MKKIFLFLVFALTVSVSKAWSTRCDEAIFLLSVKYMTPQAKALMDAHFGQSYRDDIQYLYALEKKNAATHSQEIHFVHLDKNLKLAEVQGDDAVKALESALEVIRNHKSHSAGEVKKAMRIAANLVCDIHNFAHYRIEGIEHSYHDFALYRQRWEYGSKTDAKEAHKWSTMWSSYASRHTGFSPALWAEDMELCLGDKFKEYTQGTLHEWVEVIGAKSASYLAVITPDCVMKSGAFSELEDVNYEMMVRASFRFAALLNEVTK